MTKKGKRILAVSIVFFMILVIGYLVFTGNHMSSLTKDFAEYKSVVYDGKDGTMVAFTENGAWYGVDENEVIFLEITGNEEGVITMMKNNEKYRFVAIDEQTNYAENTKEFLTRRVSIDDDFT